MIPQITRALSSGFTSKQVLDFIIKQFPEHSSQIKSALSAGFGADQILKYLSGGKKAVAQMDFTQATTEHEQTRSRDIKKTEDINKIGNAIGGAIVAAPLAASAINSAGTATRSALQHALPTNLQALIPNETEAPQQQRTQQLPSQPPVNGTIIPQQQALPQPEVNTIDPEVYLSKKGVLEQVKSSLSRGNSPEQVAVEIGIKANGKSKIDPELLSNIEAYAQKQPPEEETGQAVKETTPIPPTSPEEKVSKGSIVETPDGIGEVKEIRNGKALVEVNGKMRKVLEEELMHPGVPQQDLATLHDELIEGIKRETGKEVSRHVETAGYDPEHKELIYRPWGDKEYVYDNIDPEDVEMLTNLLTQRKTTGENFIGAWEAGTESPIGAAMHALITKIRNKAKEEGKEKAHKRRYESIYSAYEPAQKASKQKKEAEKKRLKDEEKRRKKAEKQALKHSSSLRSIP